MGPGVAGERADGLHVPVLRRMYSCVCGCTSGVRAPGVPPTWTCFPLPLSGLGSPSAWGSGCPAADSWASVMTREPVRGQWADVSSRAAVPRYPNGLAGR